MWNFLQQADTQPTVVSLLASVALTQPRMLVALSFLPMFNAAALPGMTRFAVSAALGVFAVPAVLPGVDPLPPAPILAAVVLKEVFIGVLLGFVIAMPFWLFEAVGFLVDNQRGAAMGAMFNPMSSQDSSPLGILLSQTYIVIFLAVGGLPFVLSLLYDSFVWWDIWQFAPLLSADAAVMALSLLDRLMRMLFLLAAPMIVAMLLAESALALVSRSVPQLQVFFLAMPIKSALAIWLLVLYAYALVSHGEALLEPMSIWREWRPPGEPTA